MIGTGWAAGSCPRPAGPGRVPWRRPRRTGNRRTRWPPRPADADPRLVHHVEHVGKSCALLADQVADGSGPSRGGRVTRAERQHGVDRAAVAHLVVEPHQLDVVAFAQRPVVADEVLRHHEQGQPLDAGWRAVGTAEHEVDDVLADVVFAAADPHLRADEAVAAVALTLSGRRDVGEAGSGLGLRHAHRPGEPALDHRRDVPRDLLGRPVREQQVDVAEGEGRVGHGGDVRRLQPGTGRREHRQRQIGTAVGRRQRRPHQARIGDRLHRSTGRLRQDGSAGIKDRLVTVQFGVARQQLLDRHHLGEVQDEGD